MCEDIPSTDHILRHVKATAFDDGRVLGAAFEWTPKRDNDGASVNWMEIADGGNVDEKVEDIRLRRRLTWKRSHRLALLNVGTVRSSLAALIRASGLNLSPDVVWDPLEANAQYPLDLTHSLIVGIPFDDSPEAEAVRDLLAAAVVRVMPALP